MIMTCQVKSIGDSISIGISDTSPVFSWFLIDTNVPSIAHSD